MGYTETKLALIAEKAKDKKLKFISLMHHINADYLKRSYKQLKRRKAAGVDGRTLESYTDEEIGQAIEETVELMKRKEYRPQPVRRVYIDKADGGKRPLGIPTVVDKLIQLACAKILERIYEPNFLDVSYGYRPNRDAHKCLQRVNHMIMGRRVNWIIDADIKGFFDNVDHKWMMECLSQRIKDPRFKSLIYKMLKAGVMEEGKIKETRKGTPQGGIISPILANIYLHYVLDLWLQAHKKKLAGYAQLVRYADDFLIGVQHCRDARELLKDIRKRLKKFGLELSEDKTNIKEFGRFAEENRRRRGEGKPETFDFLGFTHYCTRTKDGRFKVRVKTSRKKMNRAIMRMKGWLKKVRNSMKTQDIWRLIAVKLQGHYNYYGMSGNFESINRYYRKTLQLTYKWMNRRSRRRTWYMEGFYRYLASYPLPRPHLTHRIYNTYETKADLVNVVYRKAGCGKFACPV